MGKAKTRWRSAKSFRRPARNVSNGVSGHTAVTAQQNQMAFVREHGSAMGLYVKKRNPSNRRTRLIDSKRNGHHIVCDE